MLPLLSKLSNIVPLATVAALSLSTGSSESLATTPSTDVTTLNSTSSVCRPLRHYQFTLSTTYALQCSNFPHIALFDVQIPDRGRVAARAAFVLANSSQGTNEIYYWGAYIHAGRPIVADIVGDDICPGANSGLEQVLGYGELTDAYPRVRVMAYQGASNCSNGRLLNWTGGYLDVWVEDPACPGTDIIVKSHGQDIGLQNPYWWSPDFSNYLSASVTTTSDRSRLRFLANVVGSPLKAPKSSCTAPEPARNTLRGRVMIDQYLNSEVYGLIPASGGMGHLLLSSDSTSYPTLGPHSVYWQLREEIDTGSVVTGNAGGGGGGVLTILRFP